MISGALDHPPPELPWQRQLFTYFFVKFNQPLPLGSRTRLGGARQLGWATYLASSAAGWVTLASGKAFLHTNALARLTGTTLGVASIT